MAWGVRWYLAGCGALGVIAVLAGCSGGGMFAARDPWRLEAEIECLGSGAIREGAGVVRINPIRGPGICGADFPFKVSTLGESSALGFADDPRPPAAIPRTTGSVAGRWPLGRPPSTVSNQQGAGTADRPVSLDPPGGSGQAGGAVEPYDFRAPYGGAAPSSRRASQPGLAQPRTDLDLSPVPYERRRLIDAPPSSVTRAPLAEPASAPARRSSIHDPSPSDVGRPREPETVPLGPSRGPAVTGAVTPITVTPAATLACPMVSELERWIATAVQPAAMRWFGTPVAEIRQISAYSCRGMNGNPRARISEHAFGNALDIASFTLADGRTITVKGGWSGLPEEQGFLRDVQGAACDRFSTVLAPGSNVYHYDHIHVDLMRRYSGNRACNPRAVSGEEVAARAAGRRYAVQRASEPIVTGALGPRPPSMSRRSRAGPDDDHRFPALPLAEPGNDGED
jgi:extensin-like protein